METETTTQQLQVTQNIPATGYSVSNEATETGYKNVEFSLKGDFTFSVFAVKQLIQGYAEHVAFNSEHSKLATKLAIYGLSDQATTIPLKREEVAILRVWLETRMSHCEEERDSRATVPVNPKEVNGYVSQANATTLLFNPDTYIAQKFLLLDLREFLSGEIIGD